MKRMFLMACVMCLMTGATLWAQSAEPLTLSYGNDVSRIVITPDGYRLGSDATLVPYTGAYVLTGSAGGDALEIYNGSGVEQTFDITFDNLQIQAGEWEGAVAISSGMSADTIVLNLKTSSTCLVRSGNHTALASRGDIEAPRIINLSVLDGTLTLETQHEAGGGFAWSSDYNTTFNLVNTLTIDGASSFTNSEQGSVTLKSNFLYTSNNDGTHQKTLAGNSVTEDCSYRYEPVEGAEQHKGICIHCGYQIEPEPCTPSDEWVVKDDQYHGKTCSICGQIVSPELHADLDNDHKCDYCGMVILAEPDRTAEGVYQISNMAELYWFASLVNGTLDTVPQETEADAVLTADIVINENVLTAEGELVEETDGLIAWTPMGSESAPFNGTFDGQGHTISGLYINQPSADVQGLFGYTGYDSNVSRIEVTGSYIHGQDGVGGITGYNFGTLTFCSYSGTVIGYYNYLGGVAGGNYGTVSCCYATGKVHATNSYPHVGGVVGNNYGTISSCYSTASFSADNSGSIGGVASYNAGGRHITDSYYLQGSADKGVDGNGGTVKNVESRTAEQFAGGEVTWLLNGQSDENPLWFQTLGTDTLPVWDNTHGTVYATGNCPGSITYNNQGPSQVGEHTDTDGDLKCDYCGMVILAEPDRTAEGVYQISNMTELYWFAALVNGTLDTVPQETEADAVLTADIVINENVLTAEGELVEETDGLMAWTPMGSESAPFNGTFDGQGHTISGLYINRPSADNQGLFGYTGYDSNVSRIEVTGSYIHGQDGVGGITGYNYGILTACSYSGTVIGNNYPLGGVAGGNDGTVSCCYATGKVHGTGSYPHVGGVVGINYGTISSCYSTASLSADNSGPIGGVASYNDDGHITDSYYLQGSADKGVDKNWGTVENVESRTAEQFAGGEVTWLLNGQSDENPLWFQTLGTDTLPVWDNTHGTVYATGNCPGEAFYSNEGPSQLGEHTDTDGDLKCDYCGMVILAEPDRTAEGVYQISNMTELYWFAALVNGTLDTVPQETEADAVLTADIVINENVLTAEGELVEETDGLMAWTPMGSESAPFNGTFDGQGHTISGLYINQPSADNQGLFGYTGYDSNVSRIEVTGSYIHGQDGVGGITGYNNYGILTACSYSGTVIGNNYSLGGVVGENDGTVSCCYATGKVHATGSYPYVGGVVGDNYGTISSCYSTALLSTDASGYIGGVASYNADGHITDSYYLQGSADKGVDKNWGTVENVESRTAEQFAGGEVTWLLNGQSDENPLWFQTLGTDTLPVWDNTHGTVYATGNCPGSITYNNQGPSQVGEHTDTDGDLKCDYCGMVILAEPDRTAEGVYQIGNIAELYWFAALVNGTLDTVPQETEADAVLTADIVINENVLTAEGELVEETDSLMAWTSMGSESAPFNGTFDGQGHTISGLYINQPKADEQGLFGYVGSSGNVSRIEVTGSYIHGQDGVGGITGINNGLLTACSYSGTVIGYDYPIGGVAGENNGTVSGCCATGKVHATGSDPYVGGVVGDNYGTISSCYSTALLSTDNSGSIGGVASYNDGGPITDSYYLHGSADKGVYEGYGTVENVESRTAEQFASGEVTWLLQHAITDDTQIWGQNLLADTLPVLLSEHKVYAALFIHETTGLQMMGKYGNQNAQIPLPTAEELGANGEVSFSDMLGNPLTETITLLSDTVILVNCRLYSITVSNNILNGDISVPYDSYNVGAEVTVEAIPYSGYEPLCLYVQTYDGQEYEYEDFSFTMPAADVVLSADFIPYLYGATYTISEDDNGYNVMLTWDYDASDCHTLIYRDGNLLHTTEVNETSWQEQISEAGAYNYTIYVENAQGVRSRGTLLTVYAYPSTPMGTSGTQSIDLGDVPELFTDDGGRNGNYSNDVDVTTEITAQEDCRIYLTGNYDMESGWDNLSILDSNNSLLGEYSGKGTIEPALLSSGNTLSVRFTSDGSNTHEGFELYMETVYPVTINVVGNGTVVADTTWARAGEMVTLTPVPNEQYAYVEGSLKVLKADDPTVEVSVNADGSFTMPAFKITVTATFESSTALSVAETAAWNVFGTDGMLHITGTEAEAEVYDVRGVLLYRGMDRNLYMPTGVYIVRAEGQVQKAIVK